MHHAHKWRKRLLALAVIALLLMIFSSFGEHHYMAHGMNNFGGHHDNYGGEYQRFDHYGHVNPLFSLIGTLFKVVFTVVLLAAFWMFWKRSGRGSRKGLLIALAVLVLLPFCGPLLFLAAIFFFIRWRKKRNQATAFDGGFGPSADEHMNHASYTQQEARDTLDEWERKIRVNLKKEDN